MLKLKEFALEALVVTMIPFWLIGAVVGLIVSTVADGYERTR